MQEGTADAASVKIDEKTFPDVCVRTAVAQYDKNKDGILSDQERDKVTGIDFDSALAQHYTEGHCVDFEGMQNFTDINSIYLDLRYKAKNNSYKYWNYRADNLTQCFPNAQRISIYWYGNQTISVKRYRCKCKENFPLCFAKWKTGLLFVCTERAKCGNMWEIYGY